MNHPILNNPIAPLLTLLLAATLWGISQQADVQSEAEIEETLATINSERVRDLSIFYTTHADKLRTLGRDRNTRQAMVRFSGAIDRLSPAIPADIEYLRSYYSEKMLPWITDTGRKETRIGTGVEEEEEEEEEEEVRIRMSVGIHSLMVNDHISGKLQNRYLAKNPNPVGKQHLFSGDTPLPLNMDPAMAAYDSIHQQYHPLFFEHLRSSDLYDLFLMVPESRLGKADDARVVYSVVKEVDFSHTLLSGAISSTALGDIYRMAANQPAGRVFLNDIKPYLPSGNRPAQFMATPVWEEGQFIGVLAQQVNLQNLNEVITLEREQQLPTETLIVNSFNQVIVGAGDLRWYDNVHLRNRESMIPFDRNGVVQTRNFRETPVYSAYAPAIPGGGRLKANYQWRLLTEAPQAQIWPLLHSPWQRGVEHGAVVLLLLGGGWLLWLLWQRGWLLQGWQRLSQQTLPGRAGVMLALPLLLLLGITLQQQQATLAQQELEVKRQIQPTLHATLENLHINTLLQDLNRADASYGALEEGSLLRLRTQLEARAEHDLKRIRVLLPWAGHLSPAMVEKMESKQRTLQQLRVRVSELDRRALEAIERWQQQADLLNSEINRLGERYPQWESVLRALRGANSHALVELQEILLEGKRLDEMTAVVQSLREEAEGTLTALNGEALEVTTLRGAVESLLSLVEDTLPLLNLGVVTRQALQQQYAVWRESLRQQLEQSPKGLSQPARRLQDVIEHALEDLHHYGAGKVFEEEEGQHDRHQRVVEGAGEEVRSLFAQEEELTTALVAHAQREHSLFGQWSEAMHRDKVWLETLLKKKKSAGEGDTADSLLFLYQMEMMEDARQLLAGLIDRTLSSDRRAFLARSLDQQQALMERFSALSTPPSGFSTEVEGALDSSRIRQQLWERYQQRRQWMESLLHNRNLHLATQQRYSRLLQEMVATLQDLHRAHWGGVMDRGQLQVISALEQQRRWIWGEAALMALLLITLFLQLRNRLLAPLVRYIQMLGEREEKPRLADGKLPTELIQLERGVMTLHEELNLALGSGRQWVEQLRLARVDQQILQQLDRAVVILDHEGRIQRSNPAFRTLFRLQADELEQQLLSLVASGLFDLLPIKQHLAALIEGRSQHFSALPLEMEHPARGEMALTLSGFGTILEEEEEEFAALFRKRMKIVQRRAAELAATHPAEFQQLLESAPLGVLITDQNGKIGRVNVMAAAMLEYGMGELEGAAVEQLVPAAARANHQQQVRKFSAEHSEGRPMGQDRQLFALRKDGSEVELEIGLIPLELEGVPRIVVLLRDVANTPRWDLLRTTPFGRLFVEEEEEAFVLIFDDVTEAAAERNRLMLSGSNLYRQVVEGRVDQQIVAALDTGILLVNREGRVERANRAFLALFRLRPDLVEQQLLVYIEAGMFDLPVVMQALQALQEPGESPFRAEAVVEHPQIGRKVVEISAFGTRVEEKEERIFRSGRDRGLEKSLVGTDFEEEEEEEVKRFLASADPTMLSRPLRNLKLRFGRRREPRVAALSVWPFHQGAPVTEWIDRTLLGGALVVLHELTEVEQCVESIGGLRWGGERDGFRMQEAVNRIRHHRAAIFDRNHRLLSANEGYLQHHASVRQQRDGVVDESGKPLHCYQVSHLSEVPCWEIEDAQGGTHPCAIRDAGYRRATSGLHVHFDTGVPRSNNLNYYPLRDEQGVVFAFLETMVDVSDSLAVAEQIAAGGRVEEVLFKDSTEAMVILDEVGVVHSVNLAASLMIPDGLGVGQPFGKLLAEEEEEEARYVLTFEDVTERALLKEREQLAQKEVAQSAYQAGLAEISSNVLHNIGNAVAGMSGRTESIDHSVELLQRIRQGLEQAQELEDLETLRSGLRRSAELIGEVSEGELQQSSEALRTGVAHISDIVAIQQEMARGDVVVATTFNLEETIRNVLTLHEDTNHKHEIAVELDLAPEINDVVLPHNPFIQMVDNLVKNSREAILDRRKLEAVPEGRITIRIRAGRHGHFNLLVADNGIGIEKIKLKEIFRHGITTKASGSGFGLHSVATFVRANGGTIEAQSEGENRGAQMVVSLPLEVVS